MIAVDTSALIAILQNEDEATAFMDIIAAVSTRLISATSMLEASLVIAGRGGGPARLAELDDLLNYTPFEIVPFDHHLALTARQAFLQFGKGRHPAGLNMGNCASYALAKSRNLPLLFKGNDFSRTDVRVAA